MLFLFCFIVSPSIHASAGTVQLPKTGQTSCYDSSGGDIPCGNTGQDGEWRVGVSVIGERFTSGVGAQADCVTDNLTGLMWVKTPDSAKRSYKEAIDYAGTLNLCGFTDWRIPTIVELESLVNAGQTNPAAWLNTQGFSNVKSDYYGASSNYTYDPDYTWRLYMPFGFADHCDKGEGNLAWPVRGGQATATAAIWKSGQEICYNSSGTSIPCAGTGQDADLKPGAAWPSPRFAVNGAAGTVADNLTGLVWLKNANCFGAVTWDQALSSANSLANGQCGLADGSQAGDWRLPNRKELFSLVAFGYAGPALANTAGTLKWTEGDPFDYVQPAPYDYWSSTTFAYDPYYAWGVWMYAGYVTFNHKSEGNYVWPVRGGESFILSVSKTGAGTVTSSPAGISCGLKCEAFYSLNSVVTLSAIPDTGGLIFSGWSDSADCSDGTISISADTSCTATFTLCQGSPVSVGGSMYDSINAALAPAASTDTIKIMGINQPENVTLASGKTIKLDGGYDCSFTSKVDRTTTITGSLTISSGTVEFDSIVIL
ncbi:MAG: DUF1566 domain-containing protein [Nitrospirae bacterium]|nr:DUF1566 domain-containing protein [Nitrospirota bacterium]